MPNWNKSGSLLSGCCIVGALLIPLSSTAAPYSVLLESNLDRVNNEIYLANYDSYDQLLSNTLNSSSAYSDLNVSSAFSVGGYTHVGSGFSVLLESNADRVNNEIYVANYASYADLLSNTLHASSAYSALNVSSAFSVGGYTFNGSEYIVLLESNADRVNNEIYLAVYDSFDDFLTNTLSASSAYSALNVSSAFGVGGFSFNGVGYSVLLESNEDRVNNEIYIANYDSFDDLLNNILSSTSGYSDLNVSSAFSVGGLAVDWMIDTGPGGGPGGEPPITGPGGGEPGSGPLGVPEPGSLGLVGLAGLALMISRRRRNLRINR